MMVWSCQPCAEKVGAKVPHGHQPTWWTGKCDLCGKEKAVTAERDFSPRQNIKKAYSLKQPVPQP